ncbi:AIPR family protein [Coleofasciculus sp.]|uniref:AIPR family protein n=1 Tax=Coleofasciculus sp. TaxID=3100458 RepID=UPI003A151805
MNINASIIDQRLTSVVNDIRQKAAEELRINDQGRLKSLAFAYLCVKTILDLENDNAFDCLTEGGGDFGVDAMHISEEYDGEFTVTLFQAEYKNNLEGNSNFPEQGIESLINAIQYLFNPAAQLEHINERLLTKVEEARSLIRDGYIPQVRAIACNNGLKWNESAQGAIERTGFGDQVTWEHVNHERLVQILQATRPVKENSQNPVDLKDLRANDERQQRLDMDMQQLGFNYRRKRSDTSTRSTDITSGVAAEAVLSVWREKPHQAKFFSREHFGKLYDSIFTDQLNGSQVIIAVQLYRIAENRRKRPEHTDPDFVRYASCFIAMQMGRRILADMGIQMREISHHNFPRAQQLIEQNGEAYFNTSVQDIQQALHELYGRQDISLQQLSATFRRGDLITRLQ